MIIQSKVLFLLSHAHMVQSAILSLQALVMEFVQMGIAGKDLLMPWEQPVEHGRKSSQEKGRVREGLGKPQLCMIYLEHVYSTGPTAIGRTALLHKPQGKSISCQAKQTAHIQNLTGKWQKHIS